MTNREHQLPRDGASLRPRAFWRLLGRLEHERLEFKCSANHLCDAIPAMSMSEGGVIVLGVSDEHELVGRALDQPTLDRITAAACECGVDVSVRAITVGRTPLALVPAVRDRIVTTADGRLLRRVGATNQPLRGDAVSRFVRARPAPG